MRKADTGQALVFLALGMVAILGFLGLGLDMGYLRYSKRQAQKTADASAIAGAMELNYCAGTHDCADMTQAALDAVTENGLTGGTLVKNCGTSTASLVVMVNNPPCYLGSITKDPHFGNVNYTEVVVSEKVPTNFSQIFGVTSETVSARSEATLPGGGTCMFTLGTSGADVTMVFALQYNSQCGWVDESTSSNAFSGALGFYDLPYFGIVGGNSCFLCFPVGGGANATTGIITPTPADPLAYLQPSLDSEAPSPSSCGSSTSSPYTGHSGSQLIIGPANSSAASPAILNSGTYCGGINITYGGYATFNSGIYTLTSTGGPGGLTIDARTTVTGNGVGFYNYGPSGGVNFIAPSFTAGGVTLTAPNATNCGLCGSAWQGILFYQDPGDTATSVVVGSASFNTKLTGTSYFPNADITYALDATVNYNEVVAKSVVMGLTFGGQEVTTNFNNNYNELANGNPIKSSTAVLAE